jgi:hypothetical protein
MWGVRPAIMPRLYALMFHMPMSSPMMKTMFGFACANARLGATVASAAAATPVISDLVLLK